MSDLHHIFLVPGMFGFGRLAGADYFHHVRGALETRFAAAGKGVVVEVVASPPTSSLRHRARILARCIQHSLRDETGPIHLVGHSTGGLDIRLLLSPTTNLGLELPLSRFMHRVRTATTMNTPHYGTPLAGYFATAAGTRLLHLLSLLTAVSLSLGEPSLAVFSRLVSAIGGIDSLFGDDLKVLSRVTDALLKVLDDRGRDEVTRYLGQVRRDQGGIIQIMPEAIDLLNAATEDNDAVAYGCLATAGPPPRRLKFATRLLSPWAAATAAIYTTVYQIARQYPAVYPYAEPTEQQAEQLRWGLSGVVDATCNDGIVPTLSMLWGELLWCGEGDHLDVLGHFHDDQRPAIHKDWVTSGAHFTRQRFGQAMDSLVRFLMRNSPA